MLFLWQGDEDMDLVVPCLDLQHTERSAPERKGVRWNKMYMMVMLSTAWPSSARRSAPPCSVLSGGEGLLLFDWRVRTSRRRSPSIEGSGGMLFISKPWRTLSRAHALFLLVMSRPLVPERFVDVPSQRLYCLSLGCLLQVTPVHPPPPPLTPQQGHQGPRRRPEPLCFR